LREELSRLERREGDDLIPHTEWPVGGRKRAARLASSGKIPASKQGDFWYARRADVDAFLAPRPVVQVADLTNNPPTAMPPSLVEMAKASARKRRRAA